MANEKLLIDLRNIDMNEVDTSDCTDVEDILSAVITYLSDQPIVDAVPVDEIRVDFERLCLENQEAILNVSICGKPNEVKLPFSKDVAEVVHGTWENEQFGFMYYDATCSVCKSHNDSASNYYPHCGAKMDGVSDG